jgi:hypothetical protein
MKPLTQEQIDLLQENLEDAWNYIGASQSSGNPFYILKGINDQIKADGLDWQYELNEKGRLLQEIYEQIYAANKEQLEKK